MKILRTSIFLFLLLSFGAVCAQDTISNKHLLNAVLWFQHSPEKTACYLQAYHAAQLALDQNLRQCKKNKLKAVVVDVDETVLDNGPFMGYLYTKNKSFTEADWHRWVVLQAAKALPGSVGFLKYAESKKVEVYYITNRSEADKDATISNLKKEGFPFADAKHVVCMKTESSKVSRRNELSKTHEILLSVGDNMSDLTGAFDSRDKKTDDAKVLGMSKDFGTRYIVLPNPMYGDWENALFKRSDNDSQKAEKRNASVISFE